jgi:cytosine/adenosine deaminase-related metal-dependent hydrolase
VGLEGAFVLPGLINAHDHLELNHYGALKRRARYLNVADWIDDLRPVIRSDPEIRRATAFPLVSRVFIGGLKNLLAGATTVAHHNPLYREIARAVPIRVVNRFGWAHSLGMEDQPVGAGGELGGRVLRRCADTPADAPFIVHAGEGVDERAAAEMPRLQAEGCVRANTVLVHGVSWSLADWQQLVQRGAGMVWCPGSNAFLFGRTARVREFLDWSPTSWRHISLGSDSRLTGARDLLDELRIGAGAGVTPAELLTMVTSAAARLLRLEHAGRIEADGPADLIVVPAAATTASESLLDCDRKSLRLVMIGGRPLVGDPELGRVFDARAVQSAPLRVDGVERIAEAALVRAVARCPIAEPGVSCSRAA